MKKAQAIKNMELATENNENSYDENHAIISPGPNIYSLNQSFKNRGKNLEMMKRKSENIA